VVGVTVEAEWSTAGDDRVCGECQGLEGIEYTLDQIEGMIPVHPSCRCVALPVVRDRAPMRTVIQDGVEKAAEEVVSALPQAVSTASKGKAVAKTIKIPKVPKIPKAPTPVKVDMVTKAIAKDIDDRVKDVAAQCHEMVSTAAESIAKDKPWWANNTEVIQWDETKWKQVAKELANAPKFKNKALNELVEDISDFSVNGHSFMRVKEVYVDPYLSRMKVPLANIQEFDAYLHDVFTKTGIKTRSLIGKEKP
jgi:hypothetical protein